MNARSIHNQVFKGESKFSRFATAHRDKPGPGHYSTASRDVYNEIMKQRSRLGQAAAQAALGSAERLIYFKPTSATPGPGEYATPSAFGQYMSRSAIGDIQDMEESEKQGCRKKFRRFSENNSASSSIRKQ